MNKIGIISPVFQYEIRYTKILNFSQIMHKAVSPFVPLASNVIVENENSKDVRYTLEFPQDNFRLIIAWDRLVIRAEGSTNSMSSNNSIMEDPFFNVFEKISNLEEFGKITDVLLYAIVVSIKKDESDNFNNIINRYVKDDWKSILPSANDVALNLVDTSDGNYRQVIHGPYLGFPDLHKRNAFPNYLDVKQLEQSGEMAEIKIFQKASLANFDIFKKCFNEYNNYINRLWG